MTPSKPTISPPEKLVDSLGFDEEVEALRDPEGKERLTGIRSRLDQAYMDKLDGKISEDFWQRKTTDWQQGRAAGSNRFEWIARFGAGSSPDGEQDFRTRE